MRFLICYDVADDRRRGRVAQAMEDHGRRVQYSVFECDLNEAQLQRLMRRVGRVLDLEQDSVRVYRLCNRCRGCVTVVGVGPLVLPQQVQIL